MALQSRRDELLAAWRALSGSQDSEGWSTIPVGHGGPTLLRAGRHFPGNQEALLVGFTSVWVPPIDQLPAGQGFVVSRATLTGDSADQVWIALSRQQSGSLDLFAMMSDDLAGTLEGLRGHDDARLLGAFIARIRAWQDFMRHGGDGVLSPEAEVGLFGELEVLCDLISAGLPPVVAVGAWTGPLDGIHDFRLGSGAIEVKSSVSSGSFPATVGSLEQLDDSLIRPLFLACVRLAQTSHGRTLPDLISVLRDLMVEEPAALGVLGTCLLHVGYFDEAADRYKRRFSRVATRILTVSDGFPRLTRANVALQIRRARYEIDLDLFSSNGLSTEQAIRQLGVIQ